MRKGREFGNDGMVVWAGCDSLQVRVGEAPGSPAAETVADFATEAAVDATCHRERSQFKIHYNSLGRLISEKVRHRARACNM
jgi:hypothetical protein